MKKAFNSIATKSRVLLMVMVTTLMFIQETMGNSASAVWVGNSLSANVSGAITAGSAIAGSGVTNFQASTTFNNLSGNGWSADYATSNSDNDYIEFTVSPSSANGFIVEEIRFNHQWSSTTTSGYFRVYYSTDNFTNRTQLGCTNPIPSYGTDGVQVTNARQTFETERMVVVPSGKTLTLRVYVWGSTGGSYFRIDDVTISGSTSPVKITEGLNNTPGSLTVSGGQYYTGSSTSSDNPSNAIYTTEGSHSYGVSNGVAIITSGNINTQGSSDMSLSFRLAGMSIGSTTNGVDTDDSVSVEISPDGGASWYKTLIVTGNNQAYWSFGSGIGTAKATYDGDNTATLLSPLGGGTRTTLGLEARTDGYSTVTITDLPSSANMRFRITLKNNSASERWLADEIIVSGTQTVVSCQVPTNLRVSLLATNRAVLNWDAVTGAASYNIEWKLSTASSYSTINGITSNQYNLTGLTSNSKYEFRVQAVCGNDVSSYSAIEVFKTSILRTCGEPSNVNATNITANSARIEWDVLSGAISYNLEWKLNTASSYTVVSGITGTNYQLNGLTANTGYTYRIQAVCNSRKGDYSTARNFTTISAPQCGTPTGLSSSNITTTTATLNWVAVSGATSYNLQWKLSSASSFTTVNNISGTTYNLTGLTAGSNYTYQVQAVCNGNNSSYSNDANFSTTVATGPANEVIYIWSGAIQPTTATVVAKMTTASTTCRAVVSTSQTLTNPIYSAFATANSGNNLMAKMNVNGLSPNTTYYYAIESNGIVDNSADDIGKFKTPAEGAFSFKFAVGSCSSTGNHQVYNAILNKNPLFFLQIGDFHYRDPNSTNISLHRTPYENIILSQQPTQNLLKNTALAYMWDDHDYCGNDKVGNQLLGTANARQAYQEFAPHYPLVAGSGNVPIYQSFTIGRIHFILSDLRSERTNNSMFGTVQKAWFKQQCLYARDNCLMIAWVTGTQFAGDLPDNWGGFTSERVELSNWFRDNDIKNMIILSGDAHMIAIDDGSNHDFSTGNNNPYDYPNFAAAALNNGGSSKGGTYTGGKFPNPNSTTGQYGIIEVTDNGGSNVSFSFKGYRTSGNTTTESIITSYNFSRTFCSNMEIPTTHFSLRSLDEGSKISLAWNISDEKNNFIMLKSNDNIKFGDLQYLSNTKSSLVDDEPNTGWNYYRIMNIKTKEVVAEKSIFVQGKNGKMFVYPNPTNSLVSIELSGFNSDVSGHYVIYNSLRKSVLMDDVYLSNEDNKLSINTSSLESGSYLIVMYLNGMTLTEKLVIVK